MDKITLILLVFPAAVLLLAMFVGAVFGPEAAMITACGIVFTFVLDKLFL